jgi:IS1 family transposase
LAAISTCENDKKKVEMADYWPPFQHVKMTKINVDMADYWPPFQHVEMTKKKWIWRIIGHHFNMLD